MLYYLSQLIIIVIVSNIETVTSSQQNLKLKNLVFFSFKI